MSWMSDIAILIEEARMVGVNLTLSDFGRDGDTLTIDGMPVDDWFNAMIREA